MTTTDNAIIEYEKIVKKAEDLVLAEDSDKDEHFRRFLHKKGKSEAEDFRERTDVHVQRMIRLTIMMLPDIVE